MLKLHAFMQSPVLVASLLFALLDAIMSLLYDDLPVIWGQQVGNQALATSADAGMLPPQGGAGTRAGGQAGMVKRMSNRIKGSLNFLTRRQAAGVNE